MRNKHFQHVRKRKLHAGKSFDKIAAPHFAAPFHLFERLEQRIPRQQAGFAAIPLFHQNAVALQQQMRMRLGQILCGRRLAENGKRFDERPAAFAQLRRLPEFAANFFTPPRILPAPPILAAFAPLGQRGFKKFLCLTAVDAIGRGHRQCRNGRLCLRRTRNAVLRQLVQNQQAVVGDQTAPGQFRQRFDDLGLRQAHPGSQITEKTRAIFLEKCPHGFRRRRKLCGLFGQLFA
ncbi:MAG: hypothetical protein ALAOOOJD_00346 [bacterium]|nr:hypothetical protein [bacterium]